MNARQRIVFIVPHRVGRSPGQRFRFEQYLNHLQENGFEIVLKPLLNENDDTLFYNGNVLQKFFLVLRTAVKRWRDVKAIRSTDIVFIYREAFFLGTTFFEKKIKKTGAKIVFDFDDAIWLMDVSAGNRHLSFLKNPSKTADIISMCSLVFAGNSYLAEYAKAYCSQVEIIPTTIDLNYHAAELTTKNTLCIGWTGTETTVKHFFTLLPVLVRLKEKYGSSIYFKLISDNTVRIPELDLVSTKWSIQDEIEQLSEIDIGIMPLPDDEWSKGKCGFKGLQYMSLSIPTILSAVGVNTEIIEDGVNGYLAHTDTEWIEKLSALIENEQLRKTLGQKGYETLRDKYSVAAVKDKYLNCFKSLSLQ